MKLDSSISAIVTGGASGLGGATVKALRAHGVKVAIFDMTEKTGAAFAAETGSVYCNVNVTNEASVDAGFAQARAANGQERILVNCAGTGNAFKTAGRNKETGEIKSFPLTEFDRITERGGVLGAMETMYQRSRIQEESLYYETLKHTGEYPIIGVNTFLSSKGSPTILPKEVIRATEEEKEAQIATVENLRAAYSAEAAKAIKDLQQAAIKNENMFEVLMEATKYCSLGQLTAAMFEVGGQYRRNM